MDYFERFIKSLPAPLQPDEQRALAIEYYETGNEDAREKLLEHNLLICATVARKLYLQFNKKFNIEDLFSMCYDELSNALQRYNPYNDSEANFSTYALSGMKLKLLRPLNNMVADELMYVDSVQISDNDDEEKDLLLNHYDESESNIPDDIGSKMFIQDISNYIDTLKHGEILKMRLGLGYSHEHTQAEISEKVHISKQAISGKITDGLKKVQNYIRIKYALSLPKYALNPSEKPKFNNDEERNRYLFESYYALNGKTEKSPQQLSDEVYLNPSTIKTLILSYKSSLIPEELDSLSYNQTISRSRTRKYIDIFNDYYGQNGATQLSVAEIQQKYGLSSKTNSIPISNICKKLIEEGIYSEEDIAQIRNSKKEPKTTSLDRHAELYFAYYGLNGYSRKSKVELFHDYNLTVNTINNYIQMYKNHLSTLSPEDRMAEFAKYAKQSELE